jgi:hypothetical protein
VHGIVLVPLDSHSLPVDVLRFETAETTLSLTGHPIVEFLLVLLHTLVFLELNDLLGDEVIGLSRFIDYIRAQQIVIFGQ